MLPQNTGHAACLWDLATRKAAAMEDRVGTMVGQRLSKNGKDKVGRDRDTEKAGVHNASKKCLPESVS